MLIGKLDKPKCTKVQALQLANNQYKTSTQYPRMVLVMVLLGDGSCDKISKETRIRNV